MTTNTNPLPAWRQKIAGIRQRVDEADAKKRQAELNTVDTVTRQHRQDVAWVLGQLGMKPTFGVNSSVGTVDDFYIALTYIESNDEQLNTAYDVGLFVVHALHNRTVWLSTQQESGWVLDRFNMRQLDDVAYDLDVAIEALEREAAR